MAQTLSDIKALLAQHGLTPKHRHGQNFLHDQRKLQMILDASTLATACPQDETSWIPQASLSRDSTGGWEAEPEEQLGGELGKQGGEQRGGQEDGREGGVVEVGPGTGVLTERLLELGARVLAVEIDTDLEPILRKRMAAFGDRFQLIVSDVLDSKHTINPQVVQAMRQLQQQTGRPLVLIANLPYHVASPLLANLVIDHPEVHRGVVMVQKEVADRLTASPGNGAYGPLGIIIQAMCRMDRITTLPPGCFWPPPQVDSAVVRFVRRKVPMTSDPHRLSRFLHTLFSKRRKQIKAILGKSVALPQDIDPTARPEQLDIPTLVRLADHCGRSISDGH